MVCMSKLASFGIGVALFAASIEGYAAESQPTSAKSGTRGLDLKVPSITRIFTPQQIEMILARATAPELEHVEVEASRISDVPFRDKSASSSEAMFEEVVRWFVPYPDTAASQINARLDMTEPQRPVPISLSSYHASFPPPYSQR